MKPIGLLALQGDFPTHAQALARRGVPMREVRAAGDLAGLSGIVLPGGESTTMLRLLDDEGLFAPLRDAIRAGLPTLATCAGAILLAREVSSPGQRSLELMDIAIDRNAYGRQLSSGVFPLSGSAGFPDVAGVFIRAPRITRVGGRATILARRDQDPVLVQQEHMLAATFHPEMDDDHPACRLFLDLVRSATLPAPR